MPANAVRLAVVFIAATLLFGCGGGGSGGSTTSSATPASATPPVTDRWAAVRAEIENFSVADRKSVVRERVLQVV